MGLDVYPLGKAKPGHEEEWARLMEPLYEERGQSDEEAKRLGEISIMPYEALGAPGLARTKRPTPGCWSARNRTAG